MNNKELHYHISLTLRCYLTKYHTNIVFQVVVNINLDLVENLYFRNLNHIW